MDDYLSTVEVLGMLVIMAIGVYQVIQHYKDGE